MEGNVKNLKKKLKLSSEKTVQEQWKANRMPRKQQRVHTEVRFQL